MYLLAEITDSCRRNRKPETEMPILRRLQTVVCGLLFFGPQNRGQRKPYLSHRHTEDTPYALHITRLTDVGHLMTAVSVKIRMQLLLQPRSRAYVGKHLIMFNA